MVRKGLRPSVTTVVGPTPTSSETGVPSPLRSGPDRVESQVGRETSRSIRRVLESSLVPTRRTHRENEDTTLKRGSKRDRPVERGSDERPCHRYCPWCGPGPDVVTCPVSTGSRRTPYDHLCVKGLLVVRTLHETTYFFKMVVSSHSLR